MSPRPTCGSCGAYANAHDLAYCMNGHPMMAIAVGTTLAAKTPTPPRDQIFGWTQLEQAPPGQYVKFINVFTQGEDSMVVAIRNHDCAFTEMVLPGDAAVEMAVRILEADRRRAQRANGLPETPGIRV